jgi:hypothetical protein
MKAGGGRNKGNGFEREVARMIIKTFATKQIDKDDCYRTPGSGGHLRASRTDPGDLVISRTLRRYFNFSVECKFYRTLDWHRLMSTDKHKGLFSDWWAQCTRSAAKAKGKPYPLLVFRKNNGQAYCMYPLAFDEAARIFPYLHTRVNGQRVRVVLFKQFLGRLAQEAQ